MEDLNNKDWKEFSLNDKEIFEISRGRRHIAENRIKGDIDYYSASKNNNALTDKISNPLFLDENKIIFTTFGDCFYVKGKFTASDEVAMISIKSIELDIYIAMFLVSILKELKWKYNFGRKAFKKRLLKEYIRLPINKSGLIDFEFMKEYIKDISKKVKYGKKLDFTISGLFQKAQYKTFDVKSLFIIRGSKGSFTRAQIISGEYLYVTTSNKNNGIYSTSQIFTEEGGVLTFDSATEGKCFYQEEKFIGSDHVEVLEPIDFKLNKYLGLYFVTSLNMELFRYSFGIKRSQERMIKTKIYLPYIIDKNEEVPDFEYMEKYMKALPYSKYI